MLADVGATKLPEVPGVRNGIPAEILQKRLSCHSDIPGPFNRFMQKLNVLALHSTPTLTREPLEQVVQIVVLAVRHASIVQGVLEEHFDDVQPNDLLADGKAHLARVLCVVRELRLEVCEQSLQPVDFRLLAHGFGWERSRYSPETTRVAATTQTRFRPPPSVAHSLVTLHRSSTCRATPLQSALPARLAHQLHRPHNVAASVL